MAGTLGSDAKADRVELVLERPGCEDKDSDDGYQKSRRYPFRELLSSRHSIFHLSRFFLGEEPFRLTLGLIVRFAHRLIDVRKDEPHGARAKERSGKHAQ